MSEFQIGMTLLGVFALGFVFGIVYGKLRVAQINAGATVVFALMLLVSLYIGHKWEGSFAAGFIWKELVTALFMLVGAAAGEHCFVPESQR